ncbi:MAG: outer membrane protein assembly factor BamE [Burkholderiales bacterium]|nr:outer membrane protein assembly factor BamE [Burkholderiales bacterium]
MFLRALPAMAALLLASCGSGGLPIPDLKPYRIEIQQGNFVSQEMVSQLKPGMSKDQVRFVLGTPLITDTFHADRWDYVFRRQRANSRELEQRKIAVFFEDGKLKRVDGDVKPAAGADNSAANTDQSAAAPPPPADGKPQ